MTEIHLITEGSYSDYKIVGVFADKGEAESVCNHHNGPGESYNDWRIESYPLIEGEQVAFKVLTLTADYYANRPRFYGPDLRESPERITTHFPFEGDDFEDCHVMESKANGGWSLIIQGTDIERVRKVYSERKAELVAWAEGLTQ